MRLRMVQHNDKWKKKATREYHRKHGTLPAGPGPGRGQGRAQSGQVSRQFPLPGESKAIGDHPEDADEGSDESNEEATDGDVEEERSERSKYARRKIESNAWRFESEEPDPYLSRRPLLRNADNAVVVEEALEPPEPDYAHMQARPFDTKPPSKGPASGAAGRGKKLTLKEMELAPLKAQIDKANAARAFKERFSSVQTANVLMLGEDGVARRQRKMKEEEVADEDSGIDDIDAFLAELDVTGSNEPSVETRMKSKSGAVTARDARPDLDSFVDSLI